MMRKIQVFFFLLTLVTVLLAFACYHNRIITQNRTSIQPSSVYIQPEQQSTIKYPTIQHLAIKHPTIKHPTIQHPAIQHQTIQEPQNKFENTHRENKWKSGDSEGNTRLFSAYLYEKNQDKPAIVVLGLHNHTVPEKQFYCLFQYPPQKTNFCTKYSAKQIYINKRAQKEIWAIHLFCPLPDHNQIPTHVSVFQDRECAPPNSEWIPISKSKTDKFVQFGVCIETPIFGNKISMNMLIEGIERNLALGAEWITVYVQDDQPERTKVLKDYEKKGVLETVKWNLSKKDAKNSHYYAESVAINDCLFRNMLRAKYLVFTDIDELIVPQKHKNWSKMMTAIDTENTGAYVFNHAARMSEDKLWENYLQNWTCNGKTITDYPIPLYIQQSHRTPPYPYIENQKVLRQKTIVKPTWFTTVGIHIPLRVSESNKITKVVSSDVGLLNHYRTPPLRCSIACKKILLHDERLRNLDPELFTRIRSKICEMSNYG